MPITLTVVIVKQLAKGEDILDKMNKIIALKYSQAVGCVKVHFKQTVWRPANVSTGLILVMETEHVFKYSLLNSSLT
jgi:hypothetical protein